MKRVCVIGAGVVGCSTAYLLSKAGHHVTLIDSAAAPATGASEANGAQLSYCYVEPLASPAVLKQIPKMLLDRESPLRFRPSLSLLQWSWGLQFLAACNAERVESTTRALLQLAELSRMELGGAEQEDRLSFLHQRPGKLVVYGDEQGLAAARRQVTFQRTLGCDQTVLDVDGCLQREPALAAYASKVAGGVWTPGEAVGDPKRLCEELVARLLVSGAAIRMNTKVLGFSYGAEGRICNIDTNTGSIATDAVVVAAGASAHQIGRMLGLRLPVYPIKGYSITLPIVDASVAPTVSVTDLRRKTVYARVGDKLRVAGMAEIVGHDRSVNPERIKQLVAGVAETFPGACDIHADPSAWAGLRPATPTSMPIIGPAGPSNCFVNVGHGALGLTLAMGSARIVQRWLDEQPVHEWARDFAVA